MKLEAQLDPPEATACSDTRLPLTNIGFCLRVTRSRIIRPLDPLRPK